MPDSYPARHSASPASPASPPRLPVRPACRGCRAPLAIRYAAASDIGPRQERNQDVGLRRTAACSPSPTGSGPAASGRAPRSSRRCAALSRCRLAGRRSPGYLAARAVRGRKCARRPTQPAVRRDNRWRATSVRSICRVRTQSSRAAAPTLTAMLLSGSRLALVHIGDTRAYLYRDGGLFQITHDHSVTQFMIDAGRLHPGGGDVAPAALAAAAGGRRVRRGDGAVRVPEEQARLAGTPGPVAARRAGPATAT